ncbi:MAG: hypothetical protein IPL49_05585 [Saprospirales bacterium]|nr:hypothetical protein [Saprospirales bacterium]
MEIKPFPPGPLSSPEWVEAIIAIPDPVQRNLQITQSYHQFTLDFRELVDRDNVCWCAFATWASRQAGHFIRKEQVPEALLELWGFDPDGKPAPKPWYWFLIPKRILQSPWVLRYARVTVEDTSKHIGDGNLLVYTKLAHLFAGFLKMVRDQPSPDAAHMQAFLDEAAIDPTTGEGLVKAFSYYFRVLSEKDPKVRAELIYAANVLIGQHEQIRLQEAIEGALTAPLHQGFIGWLIQLLFRSFFERLELTWKKTATRMMMTMDTPTGMFRLGDDVPPLPNGRQYPDLLETLTLPELIPLIEQLDYTPDALQGSGAADWTSLNDRLNYILDLFRSRQQDERLFAEPFSREHTELSS